jgi:hypothetical protein
MTSLIPELIRYQNHRAVQPLQFALCTFKITRKRFACQFLKIFYKTMESNT